MNLQTADRLRFAVRLIHILLTLGLALALVSFAFRLMDIEDGLDRAEDTNRKQTRALYIFAAALDSLFGPQPGAPRLPPLQLPKLDSLMLEMSHRKDPPMSKPSTDTRTEQHVANYRKDGTLPKVMTLRFLALLKKSELKNLADHYRLALNNCTLPTHNGLSRFFANRWRLIQSERRQRGHIK